MSWALQLLCLVSIGEKPFLDQDTRHQTKKERKMIPRVGTGWRQRRVHKSIPDKVHRAFAGWSVSPLLYFFFIDTIINGRWSQTAKIWLLLRAKTNSEKCARELLFLSNSQKISNFGFKHNSYKDWLVWVEHWKNHQKHRKLMDGLRCIDSYTRVCLDRFQWYSIHIFMQN